MPDIKIHREHSLGLAKARKIAWQWAEEVNGQLVVAADHFDLDAKLGFLLGAFSRTIEGEIQKNLDALLAKSSKPAAKAAPKKAASKK
jgi:hypothetical protein